MMALSACLVVAMLAGLAALLLARRATRWIERQLSYSRSHAWDTASLQRLFDEGAPLPAPVGWAAATDVLAELARQCSLQRPMVVVELGSGLSTLVIAAVLRRNGGGRIISLEHEPAYAARTRQLIESHSLGPFVELRETGLAARQIEGQSRPWYDTASMQDLHDIGLVFIDGPPSTIHPAVREPALDFFWPRLAPGGVMVLDDAARKAEATFIRRWHSRHPDVELTELPFLKGCIVLRKPDAS